MFREIEAGSTFVKQTYLHEVTFDLIAPGEVCSTFVKGLYMLNNSYYVCWSQMSETRHINWTILVLEILPAQTSVGVISCA